MATPLNTIEPPAEWFGLPEPPLPLFELTPAQVAFLRCDPVPVGPEVWLPLLYAGLMRPNPDAPPTFELTAKGREALGSKTIRQGYVGSVEAAPESLIPAQVALGSGEVEFVDPGPA